MHDDLRVRTQLLSRLAHYKHALHVEDIITPCGCNLSENSTSHTVSLYDCPWSSKELLRVACRRFAARTVGLHRPATALILVVVLFFFDTWMLQFLAPAPGTSVRPSCPPKASNAQEIHVLSDELLRRQPSMMSWAMSARVVSSLARTQVSIVDSGMAIRSTMSMQSSANPSATSQGKKTHLCTLHHFGVTPVSPTECVRTRQEAQG